MDNIFTFSNFLESIEKKNPELYAHLMGKYTKKIRLTDIPEIKELVEEFDCTNLYFGSLPISIDDTLLLVRLIAASISCDYELSYDNEVHHELLTITVGLGVETVNSELSELLKSQLEQLFIILLSQQLELADEIKLERRNRLADWEIKRAMNTSKRYYNVFFERNYD
ncbi:MAG TPA: hypothetical protein PLK75_00490 [Bacteroidales bacterium]|nr:hypothetical protein [Bacteroidales bacterium]